MDINPTEFYYFLILKRDTSDFLIPLITNALSCTVSLCLTHTQNLT